MAFVVPAEIGHAPYAAPLLEYLVGSFSEVQIIAVRAKLFPNLSEDCWLLYAGGHGGRAPHIGFTIVDRFKPSQHRLAPTVVIGLDEWRSVWGRRLRPYLLPRRIRAIYAAALADPNSRRLGDIASVGIGYVSGDNDFFHLRPSDAEYWKIPSSFLHPSLRNGRAMPSRQITEATVQSWTRSDSQVLLLRLQRGRELPISVHRYLDSIAGREARLGYKCRNRKPWYVVPDVQVPDFIMSYMAGRSAGLVRNVAGVTCTNSVHSVRVHNKTLAAELLPRWSTPFVRLSCELEGHALGGGMLKLEPREATRILFPSRDLLDGFGDDVFEEAVGTLRRWRHYAD